MRLGDGFAGRVDLPFLLSNAATILETKNKKRMALVRGDWFCYTINLYHGLRVHVRGKGLAGLVGCAKAVCDGLT